MDDDSLFGDMEFALPLAKYDADGVDLVLWGDEEMTYTQATRRASTRDHARAQVEWARRLLASWVDLASSALKETFTNHDQGALVHLLHTETSRWRGRTLLERNFTMNGHWPEYAGKFARGRAGSRSLWGRTRCRSSSTSLPDVPRPLVQRDVDGGGRRDAARRSWRRSPSPTTRCSATSGCAIRGSAR